MSAVEGLAGTRPTAEAKRDFSLRRPTRCRSNGKEKSACSVRSEGLRGRAEKQNGRGTEVRRPFCIFVK